MRNEEVMPLQTLYDRGKQNKVEGLSLVAGKDIKQIEPHCKVRLSRFFFFFFFYIGCSSFDDRSLPERKRHSSFFYRIILLT